MIEPGKPLCSVNDERRVRPSPSLYCEVTLDRLSVGRATGRTGTLLPVAVVEVDASDIV